MLGNALFVHQRAVGAVGVDDNECTVGLANLAVTSGYALVRAENQMAIASAANHDAGLTENVGLPAARAFDMMQGNAFERAAHVRPRPAFEAESVREAGAGHKAGAVL